MLKVNSNQLYQTSVHLRLPHLIIRLDLLGRQRRPEAERQLIGLDVRLVLVSTLLLLLPPRVLPGQRQAGLLARPEQAGKAQHLGKG